MSEKPREGETREDGRVFWRRHKKKGDIWLTKESYERRVKTRNEYRRKCYEEYKRGQMAMDPMDRNYLGKYDFSRNKYFMGVSASGKPVWVTKEKLERFKERTAKSKARFVEKQRALPATKGSIGDPHPTDPGLFVILRVGNRLYYGDALRLEKKREALKRAGINRDVKYRSIRRDLLSKMQKRIKRGEVDEATGKVFWEYNQRCVPVWLDPEEFRVRHEKSNLRRKMARQAKNSASPDPGFSRTAGP